MPANLERFEHLTGDMAHLNGTLPAQTGFGCYPLAYLDRDNSVLCANCANATEANGFEWDVIVAAFANYEDAELYCDGCSTRIESAYAEPE